MNSAGANNNEARGSEEGGSRGRSATSREVGGSVCTHRLAGVLEEVRPAAAEETERLAEPASGALRFVVYALIDPVDRLPRYIGCTGNLKARLRSHLANRGNYNGKKKEWIAALAGRGDRPRVRLLAAFADFEQAQAHEQRCVDDGRERGWPLFNREGSTRSGQPYVAQVAVIETGGLITSRQLEVLRAIDSIFRARGFGPTIRELCVAIGVSSTNAVVDHLAALERARVITRGDVAARSIVITPWGHQLLARQPGDSP